MLPLLSGQASAAAVSTFSSRPHYTTQAVAQLPEKRQHSQAAPGGLHRQQPKRAGTRGLSGLATLFSGEDTGLGDGEFPYQPLNRPQAGGEQCCERRAWGIQCPKARRSVDKNRPIRKKTHPHSPPSSQQHLQV